ncbi:MAG: hypothetical protein J6Y77_03245, partial [Paludibacteraceae bacterium]|nr:hypothetical protein [Paludibacteraceae bacterium]
MKSKKKVLLVTQSLSYGATGGGNQSANFAQMLAQMPSVALDIAVFGPEQMLLPQMDSATVLDFRCPCHRWRTLWRSLQVQPAFVSGRMYRRLKAQIRNGQYDLVVADISLFGRLIRYVKKHRLAPTMAYYQNVEYDFSRDQARVGGLKYHFLHWCVARNEALCSRYVDYTVLVNDEEEARLQQLYGRKMDCHLPVFMHRPQRTVAPSESPDGLRMLFVGSDFYANVHGIK